MFRRLFGRKSSETEISPEETNNSAQEINATEPGFYTGTATIVVYDLASLKHRLDDDADWWADPKAELKEINQRNLLILGLGCDGFYGVEIAKEGDFPRAYSLNFPSGNVFIGPGEVLTGGGDEPDESCGGFFVSVKPGDYKVGVSRTDDRLTIGLIQAEAFENTISEPVKI